MTDKQIDNYILFLLVVGYVIVYLLGYFFTKPIIKIDKKTFLGITIVPFAVAFFDYNFISETITDDWLPVYATISIIFYIIITPLIIAYAAVGRAQDAGKSKWIALLMTVPGVGIFVWIYLLLQEPHYELQLPGH